MPRSTPSRREFLRTATATAAVLPLAHRLPGIGSGRAAPINIGVVGTGGRGAGAANDCLSANEGVRLVAMGDVFRHKVIEARDKLKGHGDRIAVPDENVFDGLDAYRKVIHHPDVDVVLLTTPPAFRPQHLAEAVAAGKHTFVEKPVCVDAAGYRSVHGVGQAIAKREGAGARQPERSIAASRAIAQAMDADPRWADRRGRVRHELLLLGGHLVPRPQARG